MNLPPLISSIINANAQRPYVFILLIHVGFYFINHPIPKLSDEAAYVDIASQIADGNIPHASHTFFDRYTTIFSLALFTKLLGYSRFVIHAGNLLVFALSLPLIFNILKRLHKQNAVLILMIYGLHPATFFFIKDCHPDLYFSVFTTLSFLLYTLFIAAGRKLKHFAAFITALFITFITKETVLIPTIAFALIGVIYYKKVFTLKLIIFAFLLLALCAICYQTIANAFDTTLLERITHTKQGITNATLNTISSNKNYLLNRFTSRLYDILFISKQTQFLAIGVVPAFYFLTTRFKNVFTTSAAVLFLVGITYLSFGSVSFSSYVPIKLSTRFWIFLIAPFAVLIAHFIRIKQQTTLVLLIVYLLLHITPNRYLHIYFAISLIFVAFWIYNINRKKAYVKSIPWLLFFMSIYISLTQNYTRNKEPKSLKMAIAKNGITTLYVDDRLNNWNYVLLEGHKTNVHFKPWQQQNPTGYYWKTNMRKMQNSEFVKQKHDTLFYDGINALLYFK